MLSQVVVGKLDSLQRTKAAAEWPLLMLLRLLMPQVDPSSAYPRWCAALLPLTAPLLWAVCLRSWLMLDSPTTAGCWALLALLGSALIWSGYPADGLSFGPFAVCSYSQSHTTISYTQIFAGCVCGVCVSRVDAAAVGMQH